MVMRKRPQRPKPFVVPTARPLGAVESPFCLVVDSREQIPWRFGGLTTGAEQQYAPLAVRLLVGTLRSGDYSIYGYEQRVAVERKSLADLFATLGTGRERFTAELDRLAELDWSAVIVEASWPMLVRPPFPTEMRPRAVIGSILAFVQRYPITWIMAGDRHLAEVLCYHALERYWKEVQESKRPWQQAISRTS